MNFQNEKNIKKSHFVAAGSDLDELDQIFSRMSADMEAVTKVLFLDARYSISS